MVVIKTLTGERSMLLDFSLRYQWQSGPDILVFIRGWTWTRGFFMWSEGS